MHLFEWLQSSICHLRSDKVLDTVCLVIRTQTKKKDFVQLQLIGFWKGLGSMFAGLIEKASWYDLYIHII